MELFAFQELLMILIGESWNCMANYTNLSLWLFRKPGIPKSLFPKTPKPRAYGRVGKRYIIEATNEYDIAIDRKQGTLVSIISAAWTLASGLIIRICARYSCAITCKSRVELDGTAGSTNGCWHFESVIFHTLECFTGNLLKSLLHTDSLLGWSLIERYIIVCLTPLFSLTFVNFALCLTINFVAKHHEGEWFMIIRSSIVNEALLPLGQILKCFAIRDIIDQHAAIRSTVEGVAKWLEFLLTCSVPDLKSDHLIID